MSVSTYPEFITELSPVYCCLVSPNFQNFTRVSKFCPSFKIWASPDLQFNQGQSKFGVDQTALSPFLFRTSQSSWLDQGGPRERERKLNAKTNAPDLRKSCGANVLQNTTKQQQLGPPPFGLTPFGLTPFGLTPIGLGLPPLSNWGQSNVGSPIGGSPNEVSPNDPSVQMGVVQMGVVQLGVVQLGLVQLTPQSKWGQSNWGQSNWGQSNWGQSKWGWTTHLQIYVFQGDFENMKEIVIPSLLYYRGKQWLRPIFTSSDN